MKKNVISIATIAIAFVFAVTVIAFGVTMYSDYSQGLKDADSRFDKLSAKTAEASEIHFSGSREFLNIFNKAVGAPSYYEKVVLEVEGIEVYRYPSTQQAGSSIFAKPYNRRIVGSDGSNIVLTANIYTLSPVAIFSRAKMAFVIILAGTLAAGILLLSLYLSDDKKKVSLDVLPDDANGETFDQEELDVYNEDDITLPDETDEYGQENAGISETPIEEPAGTTAAPQPEQPAQPAPPDPAIFSPTSGFTWERLLPSRLESELVRAASNEQDLSLMIIRIPGISQKFSCWQELCRAVLNFFQYRDFIFEYKGDGFAAIMQNKDIDGALESSEIIYTALQDILTKTDLAIKPVIGISSRSLRLISADRLKSEAQQAVLRALENTESPIVGFRVNPEKYRKHIGKSR